MSTKAGIQRGNHAPSVCDPRFLAAIRPGRRSIATKHSPARTLLDVLGGEPLDSGTTMRPFDGPAVDLVAAPTGQWPIRAGSFGWVDAGPALARCTAAEVAHVFREAYRALRPGGRFTATVPLAEWPRGEDSSPGMPWSRGTAHFLLESDMLGSPAERFVLVDQTTLARPTDRSVGRPLDTIVETLARYSPSWRWLGVIADVAGMLQVMLRKPYHD